jgi:dienelactone hydrolase
MMMSDFAPEKVHERAIAAAARMLRFDLEAYPPEWISAVRRTFKQLLGAMAAPCLPNVRIVAERAGVTAKGTRFREVEFLFTSEPGADVPCWLLIPKSNTKCPVMICLQGHGAGVHISLGRGTNERDAREIAEGGDYAIQAVDAGYAALAYEQRLFGLRRDRRNADRFNCNHATMTALLLGRTMAGQRVMDVSRAIDALASMGIAEVDMYRIGIMGHSTGGLISYYAAAIEPRIGAVMASCSLCTYAASIASVDHCPDNYLPGILQYFEMADLCGLIAPRPLLVTNGKTDPLFPFFGVEAFMKDAQEIYRWLGCADKLVFLPVNTGHVFPAQQAWSAFAKLFPASAS